MLIGVRWAMVFLGIVRSKNGRQEKVDKHTVKRYKIVVNFFVIGGNYE